MFNESPVGLYIVILVFISLLFVGGYQTGKHITRNNDIIEFEEKIEFIRAKAFLEGFNEGRLSTKKYHAVGIAEFCNINLEKKEISCNYESMDSCMAYRDQDDVCVMNVFYK